MIAFLIELIAPASAQRAQIDAVNAKWFRCSTKAISMALPRSTSLTRRHFRPVPAW
jgi:hypothetical protein